MLNFAQAVLILLHRQILYYSSRSKRLWIKVEYYIDQKKCYLVIIRKKCKAVGPYVEDNRCIYISNQKPREKGNGKLPLVFLSRESHESPRCCEKSMRSWNFSKEATLLYTTVVIFATSKWEEKYMDEHNDMHLEEH